jgi:hypothetical protein
MPYAITYNAVTFSSNVADLWKNTTQNNTTVEFTIYQGKILDLFF